MTTVAETKSAHAKGACLLTPTEQQLQDVAHSAARRHGPNHVRETIKRFVPTGADTTIANVAPEKLQALFFELDMLANPPTIYVPPGPATVPVAPAPSPAPENPVAALPASPAGPTPAPTFDQSEAARLHAAGIKLCALHNLRKRPIGNGWNKPDQCVTQVDLKASGYGIPLVINGLCSIDPDQLDMASVAFTAIGFNLNEIMGQGVRTTSTRPGSGGRAAFRSRAKLQWISFAVRKPGHKESTVVFELRAGSPNLQDCCPGVAYQTVKLIDGEEVVTHDGAIFTQGYALGSPRFDAAPELPAAFAEFWEKMSESPAFRREAEAKMTAALVAAGHAVEVVPNLRFKGSKLAIEIDKPLRARYNDATPVEDILRRHGYLEPRRNGKRWMAPGSSGSPGIRLIPGHDSLWQSDHQSDPLNGTFDAAQASVVLDHNYDVSAFEDWVREHLPKQSAAEAFAGFAGVPPKSSGEATFMPLHVPDDNPNPIGNFFRTAPKPFPMDCVPKVLRDWAENQAAASGFDPGAYAYVALMAFSGWLDQRSVLRVTQSYTVPPYLWGGLVDDSGGGKSPVLNASNQFIEKLNSELVKAYLAAAGFRQMDNEVADAAEQLMQEAAEAGRDAPRFVQRIIVDATVEAIAEIAASNPEGLMYLADDVSAWLGKMDAYGGTGKDRGFYLGLNDSKRDHSINRKGKPPIFVENLSSGMMVGMQPGVVVAQMRGGATDDGLFQRFLLYMMAPAGEANFDAEIDADLNNRILDLFRRGFAAGQIDVAFNPATRKLAEEYLNAARLERHANRLSQSHANKLVGYTFRLALALHVMTCLAEGRAISPTVGVDTLVAAADIIACLRSHAFAIYEMVAGGDVLRLAQYALEHILANRLTEFTQSELSKNNRDWATTGRFNTTPEEALELLFDRGVITNGGFSQGGRRATVWLVNPELHAKLANATPELIERRKANHQYLTDKFEAIREMRNGGVSW